MADSLFSIQEKLKSISAIMAPLKEKSSNITTASNAVGDEIKANEKKVAAKPSRKRKSDADDKENVDAPSKKVKKEAATTTTDDKKAKASGSSGSGAAAKKKAPSKKAQDEAELAKYDVSSIELDGESKDAVPVYDTASDIRTKINAHLRNAPGKLSSQAAFIREIRKSMSSGKDDDKKAGPIEGLSTRSLTTFLKKSGPCGGASSPIMYASYVYFEKLRVKQDKKKTQKREEMEREWGNKGIDFADSDQRMWVHRDEQIEFTKYGRMNIHRMR